MGCVGIASSLGCFTGILVPPGSGAALIPVRHGGGTLRTGNVTRGPGLKDHRQQC